MDKDNKGQISSWNYGGKIKAVKSQPGCTIKEVKDIKLHAHPDAGPPAIQAVITFPNKQEISIIGGGMGQYGDGKESFEAWCRTDGSQPESYQSKDDVMKLIEKVKSYEKGMIKREKI